MTNCLWMYRIIGSAGYPSGNTLNYLATSGILNPANEIRKIINVI